MYIRVYLYMSYKLAAPYHSDPIGIQQVSEMSDFELNVANNPQRL